MPLHNLIYVELEIIETGGRKSFLFTLAKSILITEQRLKHNCFRLPHDSNYYLENGNLIKRASRSEDKSAS